MILRVDMESRGNKLCMIPSHGHCSHATETEFLLGIKFPFKPSDTHPALWVYWFQVLEVTPAGLGTITLGERRRSD